MPNRVERLPGQPIITLTVTDPFNPATDYAVADQQFADLAKDIPGKVYRIIDIRQWKNMQFSDAVEVLVKDSRDSSIVADTRVMTVIVATSDLGKFAASSANQTQYGYANQTKLFGSMDEALAYVRAELAK